MKHSLIYSILLVIGGVFAIWYLLNDTTIVKSQMNSQQTNDNVPTFQTYNSPQGMDGSGAYSNALANNDYLSASQFAYSVGNSPNMSYDNLSSTGMIY